MLVGILLMEFEGLAMRFLRLGQAVKPPVKEPDPVMTLREVGLIVGMVGMLRGQAFADLQRFLLLNLGLSEIAGRVIQMTQTAITRRQ